MLILMYLFPVMGCHLDNVRGEMEWGGNVIY